MTPGPRGRLSCTLDTVLLASALGLTAFLLAQLLAFPFGRDQATFSVIGDMVRRGLVPYREAWDVKPPGIYFLYAVVQSLPGPGVLAIRICEALGLASLVGAFAIFTRHHAGSARPGILGGTIAVLAHVQLEFWHTAQPESFGGILIAWALVLSTCIQGRREDLGAAGAGFLYACAGLLKPTLGLGLVVAIVFVGRRRWQSARRGSGAAAVLRSAGMLAGGAAVPLVATVVYFSLRGAVGDLTRALFVYAPHYVALDLSWKWAVGISYFTFMQWLVKHSTYHVLGLALLIGLPATGPREREGSLHAAALAAVLLVGVAVQAKLFGYHFAAALPLGGLLAGLGVWKLWTRARESPLGAIAVLAVLVLLLDVRVAATDESNLFWDRCRARVEAWTTPARRQAICDELYRQGGLDPRSLREVASWISDATDAADGIFVWGFEPGIYQQSGRRPSSRYVFNFPQRVEWGGTEARAALLDDLARNPPRVIVIQREDVLPHVTGNGLDSYQALQDFPAFRSYLLDGYRLAHTIDRYDLLERRTVELGGSGPGGSGSPPGFGTASR